MSFGDSFGDFFGKAPQGWEYIERAIRDWIVTASGLPSEKVIRAEQDGPRPAAPFITVRMGDLIPLGMVDGLEHEYDNEAANGQEIVQQARGPRELSVEIRAYTESAVGALSARALLSLCQLSLRFETIRDALRDLGLTVFDNGTISSIPIVLETKWEGRALLACRFYLEEYVELRTGYIASVRLTDAIKNPEETFDVPE
jgi:hypothetical protein